MYGVCYFSCSHNTLWIRKSLTRWVKAEIRLAWQMECDEWGLHKLMQMRKGVTKMVPENYGPLFPPALPWRWQNKKPTLEASLSPFLSNKATYPAHISYWVPSSLIASKQNERFCIWLTNRWSDGGEWMSGWMSGWRKSGWTGGWVDAWMMNGCINRR